ncbi:hypothetical protein [Luteibaculum oceani]|uniref:DUF1501 domain-containing protein n=1 Tax=Luteibaculum oceani TaxID=1294296 RepID=A0A5C6V9B2_9FLAO|nr:hypothetical protein [Luteibaculum oceani]TXC82043.1 hypothetical protein FRX97_02825 [Luteibaculum oceani]
MKRRSFIKKTGLAAGGAIAVPYILPSGRLFAQSGSRMADHVILAMYGGGIRQQESILQRYLDDSQGLAIPGNIMINLFNGEQPEDKIVYGDDGFLPGDTPKPMVLNDTVQNMGTTFREMRATAAGHYNGFITMLLGNTNFSQALRERPLSPTIFEYLRRHAGEKASKVWFVGESIRNSIPLMNASSHRDYGIRYGANFFAPPTTFGTPGKNTFSQEKIFHPEEEMSHIYKMKYFLDDYYRNLGGFIHELGNDEDEKYHIKQFMQEQYDQEKSRDVISATKAILSEFKPTLLAFNLSSGVDACHGNFTQYLRGIHSGDNKVAQVWQHVQSIPEMAGNTIMIICPEHGRDLNPNPVFDQNDWYGFDHSDANTRRIFGQMIGKGIPAGLEVGDEANPIGLSADCCLTIADILGIKNEVRNVGHVRGDSQSLLDRI